MWFKNIQLFQFQHPFRMTAEELEAKLAENVLQPCGRTQLFSYGWVSPFGGQHPTLVHACQGRFMIMAAKEEKILPAAVVNEQLALKVAELEAGGQHEVSKREKRNLREEIQFSLLAQAFTRRRTVAAYIDPVQGFIIVDSSSRPRAEELTVLLRKSLGSLKIQAVKTVEDPRSVMTQWVLHQNAPEQIEMAESCEMLAGEKGKGVIKCAQQDLSAKEIANHLQSGKYISRLALKWANKLSCVFYEDMSVKGIKFLEIIKEQLDDLDIETKEQSLDVNFALMSGEFTELLKDMLGMFGGLAPIEGDASEPAAA